MKQNATNNETLYLYFYQVQTSSELCFQNIYHQIKPQLDRMLKSMKEMSHF